MAGTGWVGQVFSLFPHMVWWFKEDTFASMGHEWDRKVMVFGNSGTILLCYVDAVTAVCFSSREFRVLTLYWSPGRRVLERARKRNGNGNGKEYPCHVSMSFCSVKQ